MGKSIVGWISRASTNYAGARCLSSLRFASTEFCYNVALYKQFIFKAVILGWFLHFGGFNQIYPYLILISLFYRQDPWPGFCG